MTNGNGKAPSPAQESRTIIVGDLGDLNSKVLGDGAQDPATTNKVKRRHHVSPAADARFLLELPRVSEGPGSASAATSLVLCRASPSHTPSTPSFSPEKRARDPRHLPSSSIRLHWQRYASIPSLRQRRAPPTWADASDGLKLYYLHLACAEAGHAVAFTLNLSRCVEDEARAQGDHALDWLRRRIAHHLKNALNRPVDFLVALELENGEFRLDGRLHLHGELVLLPEETEGRALDTLRRARAGLRLAGGKIECPTARRHQTRLRLDPDAGWSTYVSKRAWMHSTTIRRIRLAAIGPRSCAGSAWFGATNKLRLIARDLLTADRKRLS